MSQVHDRPNPEMTAFTFKECMMVNVQMTGNAYAFIEFNQAGQVITLWPLLSDGVYPYRSESGHIHNSHNSTGDLKRSASYACIYYVGN